MRIFLVLFLLFAQFQCLHAQKNANLLSAFGQKAVPIKTVMAENGFSDLASLKPLLQDRRIVGMGEATHGTKEFFQMKHRLLEFLVSECDYNVFAIEANFSESLAINDYVLHGKGDPKKALAGIYFWTWNTEEVLAMIEWMRQWNADHPAGPPLWFMGVDMQFAQGAATALRDFLRSHQPEVYEKYAEDIDYLAEKNLYHTDPGTKARLKQTALLLDQQVAAHAAEWGQGMSEHDLQMVRMHARICRQATMDFNKKNGFSRDSCMAENTRFVLEQLAGGNNKVALWAHNGHVQKSSKTPNYLTQGTHLKNWYGDDYYVIGFDFGDGRFCAKSKLGTTVMEVLPAAPKTQPYLFQALPWPDFFLDFQTARTDPLLDKYLDTKIQQRRIGALYDPAYDHAFLDHSRPGSLYDGLIFLRHTTTAVNVNGADYFNGGLSRRIRGKIPREAPVRLRAQVKLADGNAASWARLWYRDPEVTYWYNLSGATYSDTLRHTEWQPVVVQGTTAAKIDRFEIGAILHGAGSLLLDDVVLEFEEDGKWTAFPIKGADFEAGKQLLNDWQFFSAVHKAEIVKDADRGGKVLKVTFVGD